MPNLLDFEWYAPHALKIQTKDSGIRPFKLRKIQRRYLQHLKDDFPNGIIRSMSLKPRQAGWSTLIAGYNTHKISTKFSYNGLVMADKLARTDAIHKIYTRYIDLMPPRLRPMIAINNSEQVLFDNPSPKHREEYPGLSSGFITETAQDPNAGKSSSRQWAHLSEYAFYPHAAEIDTSVQNSIGLHRGTAIFKESTANGMGGDGESFFEQWSAAERGDYLYKPFFVAWYEVDDYQMEVPRGFILTPEEVELVKRCKGITNANLVWRRMKISETKPDKDSGLTPEELFKQDFPSYPEEAFLSSGRPVFDMEKIKRHINFLRENPPKPLTISFTKPFLSMYPKLMTVFKAPEGSKKYIIGADVAEGLEGGDSSSARIYEVGSMTEVAFFHGKIDPDHFGRVLVELAKIYHEALLVPEINNMGHTTLTAIKDEGYLKVYMREVKDEIDASKVTVKMGWRTTKTNKQTLLNKFIAAYRDTNIRVMDIDVLREMLRLTRGDGGEVELGGKDRVVATCLALIGLDQIYEAGTVFDPNKKKKLFYETKDLSRGELERKNG